jgi:hypothetical protein
MAFRISASLPAEHTCKELSLFPIWGFTQKACWELVYIPVGWAGLGGSSLSPSVFLILPSLL